MPPSSAAAGTSFSGSPTCSSVFFSPSATSTIPATIGKWRYSSERNTAVTRGVRSGPTMLDVNLGRSTFGRMAARDTGLPQADAQFDFGRARRRRALARISARLRMEPSDVNVILPFEEVVAALGRRGERRLGLQTIELDSIVGTVDRGREFDRRFRPTSGRVRSRWERIATAQRRGQAMPPIDVYRIGDWHFVKDGHHRVSVARALGHDTIDAHVTEVQTAV